MWKDLRHGVRSLLRDKGWTTVVVVSLALGIGANTALFSAINGLYLRKLPVKAPDTLVRLRWLGRNDMATNSSDYGPGRRGDGQNVRATVSYPMYLQYVQHSRTMDDLFACAPYGRANIVVDGRAEIANAFITTGNYYRMLGLTASPGRTIVPEDDQPNAAPVAVISARYWRTRFGGDPQIVGKAVRFNNVPVTIVGVITPELVGVQQVFGDGPDIAVPLALDAQLAPAQPAAPGVPSVPRLSAPTVWWLQVMGRLKPGVTAGQVQADLATIFQNTARAGFDSFFSTLPATTRSSSRFQNRTQVPHLLVESGARGIYDVNQSDERSVRILGTVVVLVLLIVCANVANLLLSRATTRQKEISIRLSLGATRSRLIRQLLTESVLLAAVGGTLGILVAKWSSQLLPDAAGHAAAIDWRVLAFVLGVTVLTGIAFGIAPARRATSMNVSATLKETSRSVAGSRSLLTKGLLVLQVAVSLVLLIAAGLFLRTLNNLRNVDVGFNTQNLVLFRLAPALNRYDDAKTATLVEQVTARLEAIPGVRAVAVSNVPLLSNSVNSTSFFREGSKYDSINVLQISPDYFKTMEMPLVSGRSFTERDNQAAPRVAVINETAARKYFPKGNPLGLRLGTTAEQSNQIEVVGVLRDAKYDSVRGEIPPTLYIPHLQGRPATMFHVRAAADPATAIGAIREVVRQIDPDLPLMDLATQADQIDKNLQQERVFAQAYAMFGALAMLIASVGLFGLMSYSVARRTNEIGIRMALGARGQDVL
ncbi:MAG TPA: ABC transporter permease, partial [Vicinamibacterales bacterium]|nr:ABC transporter permease [Vicinamibacterales bacterium]